MPATPATDPTEWVEPWNPETDALRAYETGTPRAIEPVEPAEMRPVARIAGMLPGDLEIALARSDAAKALV